MRESAVEFLRAQLGAAGPWHGSLEYHEQLGSTSDRLRDLAKKGAAEWSLVVAGRQTSGRGRHGRTWESPPGNLYLSVLLRPGLPSPQLGLIPLAAGVAAHSALEPCCPGLRLKWPNDLLVEGRKLGGLLAEANSGQGGLEWVVLGCGVNVASSPATATSLRECTGQGPEPLALVAPLMRQLVLWYDALTREGPPRILAEWQRRSVPWLGRPVEVRSAGLLQQGICRGLDPSGALLLEQEDGRTLRLLSGEARELRRVRGDAPAE